MRKSYLMLVVLLISTAFLPGMVLAATPDGANADALKWFRDAKFGLMISWNPACLVGTEISWSRADDKLDFASWGMPPGSVPAQEYDKLYQKFNPTEYDPNEWVRIAQDAGMKYIVFVTKHHDGFCMFDSKLTDYKVTNSPIGRDLAKELADACHRAGMKLGWYYSQGDWTQPDAVAAHMRLDDQPQRVKKYNEYYHGQLRELCTHYGKVDILWGDTQGVSPEYLGAYELFPMIRKLQSGILINDRCGLPGDYYTPEGYIAPLNMERPWESCRPMGCQWSWKPDDPYLSSTSDLLQWLVRCATRNGNLLLNTGPMPNGQIEPRQVQRLKEMGQWLKQYGESIYGTRGGPYILGPLGGSTRKENLVYVHLLPSDTNDIRLPAMKQRTLSKWALLSKGEATVKNANDAIEIRVLKRDPDNIDTLLKLEFNQSVMDVEPLWGWHSGSLAARKKIVSSVPIYSKDDNRYGAFRAVDEYYETRWMPQGNTGMLTVDLEQPVTFSRARVMEEGGRTRRFCLQYQKPDGTWETITEGTALGGNWQYDFKPVTARFVRLNIMEASFPPTICEIQLFP